MQRLLSLFFVFISFYSAQAEPALDLNPGFGKSVGQCRTSGNGLHVWIFKQWHLGSSVNTKTKNDLSPIPQEKNQTAIHRQLEEWTKGKRLKEIYVEGCTGELDRNSTMTYNGWSVADLEKISGQADYPKIVTSVPMKIKAKYGSSVRALCGDDADLVKENSLAFSDARGTLGFLTRLLQYKNDPVRVKTYLEGVISLYKMPETTTIDGAIQKLKAGFAEALKRAQDVIEKRNIKLVDRIKQTKEKDVAVVFGGIHTTGIVHFLDQAGMACTVIEPSGYPDEDKDDELKLMQKMNEDLKSI